MSPSLLRSSLALAVLAPVLLWSVAARGTAVPPPPGALARVVSHNADARDLFGGAVALSRDGAVLVVGADLEASRRGDDSGDNGAPGAGAVYVFERQDNRWEERSYLKAPIPQAGTGFGFSVAVSEDGGTLAVGAPFGREGDSGAGRVHVFRRAAGVWAPVAHWQAPAGTSRFGEQIALSQTGTTLAVSGIGPDRRVQAQVFAWRAGAWAPAGRVSGPDPLPDSDAAPAPRLALAGNGQRLALGSRADPRVRLADATATGWTSTDIDADGPLQALALSSDGRTLAASVSGGRIAVWNHPGTAVWAPQAHLQLAEGGQAGPGLALSGDGQTLVVATLDAAGPVQRFQRRGGQWYGPTTLAQGASGQAADALALSMDGRTLAVGARFEAAPPRWPGLSAPLPGAGAVHLYAPVSL